MKDQLRLFFVVAILAGFVADVAQAAVTVTAATGGTGISADSAQNGVAPAYTMLGNIVITEGANGDFAAGSPRTLILTAPSGWQFNANVGTATAARISGSGANEISVGSISVTALNITVTFDVSGTGQINSLTISGIEVRATEGGDLSSSGTILRPSVNPGTATISGITNDSTSFGSLSQAVGALRLYSILPPQTFTDAGTVAGSGISGTPAAQTADVAFNLTKLVAADREFNIGSTYSGSRTISYTGPGGTPTYTTSVVFTNGQSSNTLATTLTQIGTTTITATDGTVAGVTSSNLAVNGGPFVKLQLLVPGETAAAGNASGKTGTPTAQTNGVAFTVTVSAVDDHWNVVNTVTDTVGITSSDGNATLPADAALVSGTKSFSVTFRTSGAQTLTATNIADGTKSNSSSPPITVQKASTTTALISSVNPSCFGQTVTFTATATANPPSTSIPAGMVDFKDGATVIDSELLNGSGRASFSTSLLAGGARSITAVYNGDANFIGSTSLVLTQTVNTPPSVTLNPTNRTVCAGSSVSFVSTAGGNPTPAVQWQVSADGGLNFTNVPGATSTTYTFTSALADDGKQYHAVFTNVCGTVASSNAVLTVNVLPNCSIAGAGTLCASSTNNIYSGTAGVTGYRWSISGNGAISGATNAQSVSVTAGTASTFTLTLTLTNTCGGTSTCSKTVTNLSKPTATVSGGGTICAGNSTNIQAALTGTGPWTVAWSDGFLTNVVSSPTTRSVSPASTTAYAVTNVTDANCPNPGTGTATVTVNTPTSITLDPTNRTVCAGNSVSFTATASGSPAPAVQWQVSANGGANFTNVTGATSTTYTFTVALSDNGKQCRARLTNFCGTVFSTAATLTVIQLPDATITADTSVGANSTSNTASVADAGAGTSYTWTISGGTIAAGAGTTSISYLAGPSGSVVLGVTVSNAPSCSITGNKTVAIVTSSGIAASEAWATLPTNHWQSSTMNNGDHVYAEGKGIPFRLQLSGLGDGVSWCLEIKYDFKDGNTSRHFLDFLTTFNSSESTVTGHECDNKNCTGGPTTFPIPVDTNLSYQLPGNFTVYNGSITSVSDYTTISGSTDQKHLTITGTVAAGGGTKDVILLFGGHFAREVEWGPGNGASSFPGAAAKVYLKFCPNSSYNNLAINPGGIIKQADLAITKGDSPDPICAGNNLAYLLRITNSGPNLADPVTVLDTLPPGTALVSATPSQGTFTGTTNLNFALGTVNAGSNATITIVVAVNSNAPAGLITNTATVSALAPEDPNALDNITAATTTVYARTTATALSNPPGCVGLGATFSTTAFGTGPFGFQWTRNGATIAGATNATYSILAVTMNDSGIYCVRVSGFCNSVTNCATLNVTTNASTTPLVDLSRCPGESATFSTTPSGSGPFNITWKRDGNVLPGATSTSLTITNVAAANAGVYCVEVAGTCNAANNCATLTVLTNTTADALNSLSVALGQPATFSTTAGGTGPFAYQWTKNGTNIVGAITSSYSIASVSDANAGSYCVIVSGACGSATTCATLTVVTHRLTVTQACPPTPVTPGGTLVLSGTVSNAGSVTLTNVMVTNTIAALGNVSRRVLGPISLAPGIGTNFSDSYTVLLDSCGPYVDTLTASGADTSAGNLITESDTRACPSTNSPRITLTRNCPAIPVVPGQVALISGVVSNAGNITLTNVLVFDDQPVNNTLLLGPLALAPGQSVGFSNSYLVPPNLCAHVGVVRASGNDKCFGRAVTDSASAVCPTATDPKLTVTRTCPPQPVSPGQPLVFSGTVSNAGNITLTNVTVVNDQPSNNTPVLGPILLAPGERVNFTGSFLVPADTCAAGILSTATARGISTCNGTNVSASQSTLCPVQPTPQLIVTKNCPTNPVSPGGVLAFSGIVSNAGNITLTNVLVVNNHPTNNTPVLGPLTLAPHQAANFSGSYRVCAVCCPPFVDTITAAGAQICNGSNVVAKVTTACPGRTTPRMSLAVDCPPAPALLGQLLFYTGSVSNSGDVTLSSVLVTDNKAGFVTQIPALAPAETADFFGFYLATNCGPGVVTLVTAIALDVCTGGSVSNQLGAACLIVCPLTDAPVLLDPMFSGGQFKFSFATQPGRTYTVQYTDALFPVNWQSLPGFIGTGGTVTITDPAGQQKRFYRVLVQ